MAFIAGMLTSSMLVSNIEMPFGFALPFNTAAEKVSPSNWISENQIEVFPDKIIIRIENASLSAYADTNSMDPTLDKTANGIEIVPKSPEQIHVGDIVAYSPEGSNSLIVHRVVEVGKDEQGFYFIVKGDNNTATDGKIRFEQIKYVTIGVIY